MKTILIVDDEMGIVDALTDVLEEEGFRVISAANGQAALESFRGTKPDLIVLDLMMPVLTGYALLEALQTQAAHSLVPVVVISAIPKHVAFPAGTIETQLRGYLRKPFALDALLHIVHQILDTP